ncbi:MAG: pyridoxamine 5'-phosphate oxidase [Acidobacteria bacterium]|nr:pyridoxamine 5'-phosphate oxidase [Acidobacteriota bacterium]
MDSFPSDLKAIPQDPYALFSQWYEAAEREDPDCFNAVSLATADQQGRPSNRMVLLKRYTQQGFVFATNYESRKGRELGANPFGALLFWWSGLGRQVRIEGRVEKTDRSVSESIFDERPRASRWAAMASHQSKPLQSRDSLLKRFESLSGTEPQCPPHWGGFLLRPEAFEFWIHVPSRLHDRVQFLWRDDGWQLSRLSP